MLVGILTLVIVVAVIWDKQSDDLRRPMSVDNGHSRKLASDGLTPTMTKPGEHTTGVILARKKTPQELAADEMIADLKEEYLGSHAHENPAVQAAPAPVAKKAAKAPAPSKRQPKTYIVQEGESFWTIARDKYNDGSLCDKLWEANKIRIARPELLRAGATIILPEFDRRKVQLPQNTGGRKAAASDSTRYYVVKKGDCLGVISQKFYGTSKKWHLILKANNLEDETSLRAGMKIIIPPDK